MTPMKFVLQPWRVLAGIGAVRIRLLSEGQEEPAW